MNFVANKVQQKIGTQLPLPQGGTMPPEFHPCVGHLGFLRAWLRVFVSAVTHRQVETQSRGQLDIVHALVVASLGHLVHLACQHQKISLSLKTS